MIGKPPRTNGRLVRLTRDNAWIALSGLTRRIMRPKAMGATRQNRAWIGSRSVDIGRRVGVEAFGSRINVQTRQNIRGDQRWDWHQP